MAFRKNILYKCVYIHNICTYLTDILKSALTEKRPLFIIWWGQKLKKLNELLLRQWCVVATQQLYQQGATSHPARLSARQRQHSLDVYAGNTKCKLLPKSKFFHFPSFQPIFFNVLYNKLYYVSSQECW